MPFDLANLVQCLALNEVAPGRYEGSNLDLDYHRVFGGQLLAQTIQALRQESDGKKLKSFTQQFPREGDVSMPIRYEVKRHHAGRTFATLGVLVTQSDKLVSLAAATLHEPEIGFEVRPARPVATAPEDLARVDIGLIPWDLRLVDDVDINARAARPAHLQIWMRAASLAECTDDLSEWTHQSLLAHSTDLTLIGTALMPVEGLSQADTGTMFSSAVTSHSMSFHAPFRIDEWILIDQTAPVLNGGRAFGRGDVWTHDGRLVASFSQESMVRKLKPNRDVEAS